MEIYSLQNGLSLLNCNEAPAIAGIQICVSPGKGCHSSEVTAWDPAPWKHKLLWDGQEKGSDLRISAVRGNSSVGLSSLKQQIHG